MTKNKTDSKVEKVLGPYILANAVIWGAVIVGSAFILKDSGQMPKMLPILGGGAAFCTVILPGALAARIKKILHPEE